MNRMGDRWQSVLSSVGLALLAIATVLVPYSDLNGSIPNPKPCAVSTCSGTPKLVGGVGQCTYDGSCTPTGCTLCTGPETPTLVNKMFFCPSSCPGNAPG